MLKGKYGYPLTNNILLVIFHLSTKHHLNTKES